MKKVLIPETMPWMGVGLLIMCIYAMFAHPANSAELTQRQAMLLYTVAIGEAGIGVPDRPPTIEIVSQARVNEVMCPQPDRKCHPAAVFVGGIIYLPNDMDFSDAYNASIVAHEMVHYIQWWKAGSQNAFDCAEQRRREAQAYAVQIRTLAKAGYDTQRARIAQSQNYCRD